LVVSIFSAEGFVLAGSFGQGIFRTTDDGNLWEQTDGAPAGRSIQSLAISKNIILAGTDRGVYASGDKGLSWYASGAEYAAI
jgi:photosystem II stability/assembly factor-like uncharacterized protein